LQSSRPDQPEGFGVSSRHYLALAIVDWMVA